MPKVTQLVSGELDVYPIPGLQVACRALSTLAEAGCQAWSRKRFSHKEVDKLLSLIQGKLPCRTKRAKVPKVLPPGVSATSLPSGQLYIPNIGSLALSLKSVIRMRGVQLNLGTSLEQRCMLGSYGLAIFYLPCGTKSWAELAGPKT